MLGKTVTWEPVVIGSPISTAPLTLRQGLTGLDHYLFYGNMFLQLTLRRPEMPILWQLSVEVYD
jgi:hypothetical protein